MSRGVDVDVICLSPAPDAAALREAIDGVLAADHLKRLKSIDDLLLDELMEWILPGQRCVAITEVRNDWQYLYDSTFNVAMLADGLSRALPESTLIQFNLQEETDLTLRVLKKDAVLFEYSNAPSFFNWGRCIGKSEATTLARIDLSSFIEACGRPMDKAVLADCFQVFAAKTLGEVSGPKKRHKDGVYDAMQTLAQQMNMPRLYRFFEGWMKSDLDWDEDDVIDVLAYRQD
jgi:hypothetical protein